MAAFDLPFPPFPHDSRDVPFIATPDDNNGYAVPSSQYFKKLVGDKYVWTPVSADDPMPTGDATAQGKLADILAKISADPATQTTLAAILAKIIAAPATEAKQTALNALIGEVQAAPTANTLLARLKNLETKVDAIIADGVKLSGRKLEVKSTSYSQNINVAPEANTTITITPPVGELWRVKLLRLQVPKLTSGTTGNHVVSIMTTTANSAHLVLEAINVYSEIIDILANSIITASVKLPTTETAQQNAIQSIVATNAAPIFIRYANGTDVIQNGKLIISLSREVEYIA